MKLLSYLHTAYLHDSIVGLVYSMNDVVSRHRAKRMLGEP